MWFLVHLFVCVRAGPSCRATYWRAVLKPWCAEEEVPTAAKLNLYRGLHSRVGWHCDDEPLFGRGWVLKAHRVSFGSQALFRWKGKSCLDGDVPWPWCHSCHGWPMSGRVSSLYGSRSGTGADQYYVPLDQAAYYFLLIVGWSSMLSANVCAGFFCSCYGELGVQRFLGFWGGSLGSRVCGGCWFCGCFPSYSQGLGYGGVPFAGHAFWAEVGGDISFVTLGSFLDHSTKCFYVSLGLERFRQINAVYASLGGTAQSPWP